MIRNYFKTAFRNIFRNKFFSLINISGLAIGLSCCILLLLYNNHEISYDRHYKNADSVYRLWLNQELNGKVRESPITSLPYGPALVNEFPEVENMARISTRQGGNLNYGDKSFFVSYLYADASLIEMFPLKVLRGDKSKALESSNSIVLTRSLAKKIFGEENPIGRNLELNNSRHLVVTAIVDDQPKNTHIQFKALLSLEYRINNPNSYKGWDGNFSFYTYIILNKEANHEILEAKFLPLMEEKVNKKSREYGAASTLHIMNIKDIYLHSNTPYELMSSGNLSNIYIFSAIAIFILIIACINFMNLSTARSLKRAKEIGIRKVVGSYRFKLIKQFLGESILLCFVALIFALILVEIFLPVFNNFIDKSLSLYAFSAWEILLSLPVAVVLVGFLAGSYPAFYISAFSPVKVLKGNLEQKRNKINHRNALVVLQFLISSILISCTIIIYTQLNYMTNKDIGYKKEGLISISLANEAQIKAYPILKNELLNITGVTNVTASSSIPVGGLTQNGYGPQGLDEIVMMHALDVDEDFIKTFEMEIVKGRNFSSEFSLDKDAFLINETAAKRIGWEEPIGKYIRRDGNHKVIGVVKDFHFKALHTPIAPLVITNNEQNLYRLLIRINPNNVNSTIAKIQEVWKKNLADQVFKYSFIDKYFERMYNKESKFGTIFIAFTILAIFIACLGLLGLSAFLSEQRTKEIGIRKVLGASTSTIFKLLSRKYIGLLLIANILAVPLSWYGINKWLDNFAYRIDISWWPFLIALITSVLISVLTLLAQMVKSSKARPIDSLNYE